MYKIRARNKYTVSNQEQEQGRISGLQGRGVGRGRAQGSPQRQRGAGPAWGEKGCYVKK